MKRQLIKALSLAVAVITLLSVFLLPASAVVAPIINPMLNTYVVDDLVKMKYNPNDFPLDPSADHLQIIHFLEYGYSQTDSRYYGLYLYLYNPCGKEIALNGSTLQMCYVTGGKETKYVKYPLEVVSCSVDNGNKYIFYKLRVNGTRDIRSSITPSERVYKLASLEILYEGEDKAVTKPLQDSEGKRKCVWKYHGFQANFGSNTKDGTLSYYVDELDTIPVELHDASWMSDTSNLGEDYRWEVKSYYFNIPQSYINKYGDPFNAKSDTQGLYAVEGEYYKYGVNGLIVPDQEWYEVFKTSFNRFDLDGRYIPSWGSFGAIDNNAVDGKLYSYWSRFTFNLPEIIEDVYYVYTFHSDKYLDKYCLLSTGTSPDISNEVLMTLWEASGKPVLSNSRYMYIGDKLTDIGKRVEFDVEVTDGDLGNSIKTYASTKKDGLGKWLDKLFNKEMYTDEDGYMNCMPLVQVEYSDVSEAFKESVQGKSLYLDYGSYTGLQEFYNEHSSNNAIYLMRLGVEPYYEIEVDLLDGFDSYSSAETGYYYEKVIHKDTDIFAFTFKNAKGELQRVPVECDPVDNLGSVVEGNNKDDSNPNGYPDGPSPGEIIIDGAKNILDWLNSLKGIVVLVGSTIGITVILVLIVVFWKYLEPWFIRAGNLLGKIGRGLGAVFGFIGKLLFGAFKAVWNIAVFIGSIFFPPIAVLRIDSSVSFGSSNDSKYYYEDKTYKQKEEQRRQERHEAEMEALKRKSGSSKKPDYALEKKALAKAIEEDRVKLRKTYDTDEFFEAALKRTEEEFKKE